MGEKSRASSSSFSMEILEEDHSLSYWDFINVSDVDSIDDDSIYDGFCSWHSSLISDSVAPIIDRLDHKLEIEPSKPDLVDDSDGKESSDDDDDDGEGEGDSDLDDELVPWSVSNKFGRQRMRKLGKRVSAAKMNASKRSPYLYVRAGCVHGKHGLGLKHHY